MLINTGVYTFMHVITVNENTAYDLESKKSHIWDGLEVGKWT